MQHVMSISLREPTEEELTTHLAENPARYMTPRTVTFEHVFFETDIHSRFRSPLLLRIKLPCR